MGCGSVDSKDIIPNIIVDCDIYPVEIGIFTDFEECVAWHEVRGLSPQINNILGKAWQHQSPDGHEYFIAFIPEGSSIGTISHEALHLAIWVLDFVGVEVDVTNHEALCYLHQYIFESVHDAVTL